MKTQTEIRFGTDGWRAEIAKAYTFDNVRKVAQAISDYINKLPKRKKKSLIVGYDTRFLSDKYAKALSEVLCANNIKVLLSKDAVPTPTVSFAIKMKRLDGGIIITASHNPPNFNGIKFKTEIAASADEDTTRAIEKLIGKNKIKSLNFEDAKKSKKIELIDISRDYISFLQRYVDIKAIRAVKPKVFIDYMHGVGAGYIETVLGKKASSNIVSVRKRRDPLFGGVNPEPIPKNLGDSLQRIKGKEVDLGVALDGDADRIGAMRPDGKYITSGQIISLILLHFLEDKGLCGDVVKTISGTTLIERICKKYNLTMFETPVGFKYISALMLKENIMIGGEESGGIGFCGYIPERDGILSALLLIEMMVHRKKSIIPIMNGIDKEYGRFCYDRVDIKYPFEEAKKLTRRLKSNPPKKIAGKAVKRIKAYDGVKFIMDDESWLLLRFSGTEPLIRIYAEAQTDARVKKLLEAGKRLAVHGALGTSSDISSSVASARTRNDGTKYEY